MATRGRPPVIEKVELPLTDGTVILLRLVGDGKTAQIELPDQWTLASLDRSPVEGGRTRLSFVSTKRGKAKGARAPKSEASTATAPKPPPKPRPRKRAAAPPAPPTPPAPATKKAAPAKRAPRKRASTAKAAPEPSIAA